MICCYYYYNNYDYYSYYNPHPYYYVIWIWHGSVVWLCFDCFNPRSPRTTYTRNRVWRTPADIWVVSVPFQPRWSRRVLLWAQQTLLSIVLLTKKKRKKELLLYRFPSSGVEVLYRRLWEQFYICTRGDYFVCTTCFWNLSDFSGTWS